MKLDNYSSGAIYKHRRIKFVIWYFVSAIVFETPYVPFYSIKSVILRLFGAKIGIGLCIKPSVKIKFPWNLSIVDHVSLDAFCILLPGAKCGDKLVLSARSLAKGSLEGGYIYHGNPATAIKLRGI